ncbi:RAxF-45 family protein [Bacillus infantis]|nr:RAxF-45 family protein [Bacillus infantis]
MNNAVLLRGDWMSYLSICRAIFHEAAANGTSLSIFSNFIRKTKR